MSGNISNKSKHSALQQKAGDIYHHYVAVDFMLQYNNWTKCTIEQDGDIVLFDNYNNQLCNIEVKHHDIDDELLIHSEDFQKTLYNWFNDKNKLSSATKLKLLTTSKIGNTNCLNIWNSLSADGKYSRIEDNSIKTGGETYKNIEEYFNKIKVKQDDVKLILEKFEIISSYPKYPAIKEQIKQSNFFRIFGKNNKIQDSAIESLYSMVGNGLKNGQQWEITKTQFDQKLTELSLLAQDKKLRTDDDISKKYIDTNISTYKDKQFIKKLANIDFNEDVFQMAIDNYAKSIIEIEERMKLSSSLEYDEKLENYNQSLVTHVNDVKMENLYISDKTDIEKSQKSYFEIMRSQKIPFMPQEFDDRTSFFQKGYLHILADDEEKPKQICWSLKPEDLI